MGRTSLAIAPANQNYIYALSASVDPASNFEHGFFKVLRSTTGGGVGGWTTQAQVTSPATMVNALLSNPRELFRSNCSGQGTTAFFNQGWYDNVIAVDPINPDVVFAGGVDLFRSDNGGVAWGHISRWDRAPVVHADQHVIAFHPAYDGAGNKTMFVGNDGGVHRTTDARATSRTDLCSPYNTTGISVPWTNLNNGYAVTQFYDGTAFPSGTEYFGGAQDNGTVRGAEGTGVGGWFEELGGDGGYVAVNPTNTNIMYAESQNFFFARTTDGGANWFLKNTLPRANNCNFGGGGECMPFITPFSIDSVNPVRLYTGGWYAYRTVNQGDTWVQVGPVTPGGGETTAIATHPANPELLLVGMSDGWVGRLTNASTATSATAWATTTQPRPGNLSSFGFHPTDPNVAYATYSTFGEEHVWKTDDAGQTWISIDGTGPTGVLPDIPVHSIVVDPVNPQTLYIGTDLGIFVSTDDGATWAVENTGFANVVTEKLEIRGTGVNRKLFAFTHGRSAWRTPIVSGATAPGAPTAVAATAGNAEASINWTAPASDGGSPITNYIVTPYAGATPGTPKEVGNVLSTTVTGLSNGTAYRFTVKAKNATGTGPESALSNEVTPTLPAPPDTVISAGPSGTTALNIARFVFSSVPGGATFECRRDGGAWSACTSPRNETVIPGPFTFEVRAVGAGGPDATPALRSLRVMRPFLLDANLDAKHEVGIWRPASGGWYRPSLATVFFGAAGDVPVPGQWDADPEADFAVWRPASGTWFRQGQANVALGATGDIPVPVDWDADGDLDPTVFRPSTGAWFRLGLPTLFFGANGDIPMPGQWDADPEPDLAVFRPSNGGWFRQGQATTFFGLAGDVPVPADWDGNGQLELGVWRPASGGWIRPSVATTYFGASGDIPVLGDWDPDATPDIAVWRPASGGWYRLGQTTIYFGAPTDVP
jgi:hypothetical protein